MGNMGACLSQNGKNMENHGKMEKVKLDIRRERESSILCQVCIMSSMYKAEQIKKIVFGNIDGRIKTEL